MAVLKSSEIHLQSWVRPEMNVKSLQIPSKFKKGLDIKQEGIPC